jgi:mannose-1-phosphate guanylyltransferase/mannose-6-phosphate isomerase
VTFGIMPTHPETGYGYIRADGEGEVRPVDEFVEKPDLPTAEDYVASGGYFWNSGIFLLGAKRYLEELGRHRPEMLDACEHAFNRATRDLDFTRLDPQAFESCPSESIDYAVMENTRDAAVVPMDCGWSDLGSWSMLHDIAEPEDTGNVLLGDVIAEDTRDSYIRSEGRLVATLGVENLVVVETADAVLVASRDRVQDVKRIVERLNADGRDESTVHRRVYRPWGSYEGIANADRFQVKRIVVNPGQRLSLQMHHHRAEHWIIVSGTAKVYRGDETFLLTEDQSTYISLGTTHCLENPGVIPLVLIEVQTGSYLGEDDIVRFDDVYGRADSKSEA